MSKSFSSIDEYGFILISKLIIIKYQVRKLVIKHVDFIKLVIKLNGTTYKSVTQLGQAICHEQ